MTSQFPKLQKKLDEVQSRLDEVLKTEFINTGLIEDIELNITEASFSDRSLETDAIFSLREVLVNLPKLKTEGKTQELDTEFIEKKHILAAQSLLKIQRSRELANKVLLAAISSDKENIPELAAQAIGEKKPKFSTLTRPADRDECELLGKAYPCGDIYVDS